MKNYRDDITALFPQKEGGKVLLNNPFYYEPHPLCVDAAYDVIADIATHPEWKDEVEGGKMFGVLLTDKGCLKAYSGQILGRGDWYGYVPLVFDYLEEGGYFKTHEAEIVAINKRIDEMSGSEALRSARQRLYDTEQECAAIIDNYKSFMAESRKERERKRESEHADEAELIRESQFQKAELHRKKVECKGRIQSVREELQKMQDEISGMKTKRKQLSDALQNWLFRQFVILNGRGEVKTLLDIFSEWAERTHSKCLVPPSGSGECCAPKLLQYAFRNGMTPYAIAEFTVSEGQPKWQGACISRCSPILEWMLQGLNVMSNPLHEQEKHTSLDVLYEDEHVIIVDKPAGMLSVPGKSQRRSAWDILREMRPGHPQIMMVHRLDMQTSGILVAAKDMETYRKLQADFAQHRNVGKTYFALLEGVLPQPVGAKGEISLPLSADYLNRPRQTVDKENGKPSLTKYEILDVVDGHTLVALSPVTGRTHQLRVHCAHEEGLGMPILGDDLYGKHAERLYLHAALLTIGELHVQSKADFM